MYSRRRDSAVHTRTGHKCVLSTYTQREKITCEMYEINLSNLINIAIFRHALCRFQHSFSNRKRPVGFTSVVEICSNVLKGLQFVKKNNLFAQTFEINKKKKSSNRITFLLNQRKYLY